MNTGSVLILPYLQQEFVIETDPSNLGIGVVLMQKERPISYFSKKLSLRMQQASAYVRELYAIIEAVKKWRQYLLGRRFFIRTDQTSLRALLDQVVQTPEQQQYLAKLLGYQYKIVYKLGRDSRVVDALSKQPDVTTSQFLTLSQVGFGLLDNLRQENATSAFFLDLYTAMKKDATKFNDYEIKDGLLLCKRKLVLDPSSLLIQKVLQECHLTLIGGHWGIQKTTPKISGIFTWSRLQKDVKQFVQNCSVYQQMKYDHRKPVGLL